jgi:hypothetical protein
MAFVVMLCMRSHFSLHAFSTQLSTFAHVWSPRVAKLLADHPDYNLCLVGHSLGAGVATLITFILTCTAVGEEKLKQPSIRTRPVTVQCIGFATPAVMSE